jgi:hypothetical protein
VQMVVLSLDEDSDACVTQKGIAVCALDTA